MKNVLWCALIGVLLPMGLMAQAVNSNAAPIKSKPALANAKTLRVKAKTKSSTKAIFPVKATISKSGSEDYTTAILWEQHSGEYRALAFQAFNFARLSLDVMLSKDSNARSKDSSSKPRCVIVDIDETVLDNSPFQGYELKKGLSYKDTDWTKWTSLGIADTVPGALGFLRYAASKNVETIYLSNRLVTEHDGTLRNLQEKGFPYADDAHLLLKTTTSDKGPRRQQVMAKYNVLLLCGDNLSDFSNLYYREGKAVKEQVDLNPTVFGARFIMLPNAMYGDWEKGFYQGKKVDEQGRSQLRTKALKTY